MFKNIAKALGGDPQKRELERVNVLVDTINQLESEYESLSADGLRDKSAQFRQRLAEDQSLDDLLVETFAAVREASKRTTGLRHFDIQLIGGVFLHEGKIAEMRTGEGKTLVATLPLYLNALNGKGAHLITVNDYLARRDARWMAPIYHSLGLSVGVLQMSSRTESAHYAFLVDLDKRDNREEEDQLKMVLRRQAYAADITYGTNNEFGFDYLRDNLVMSLNERVQRGHAYAIVDEVDNILIDEARTPLIISGPASEDVEWYGRMAIIVRQLTPEDYDFNEKDRSIALTEIGEAHVEELLQMPLRDPDRPEDITPEQARLLGYLEQALKAQLLFTKNKDYIIQNGQVIIVDEFTGRLMPGRRWSEGLHQAVEAKEGVKVNPENITQATITLQNYFRKYKKLAGMTGTALTEAEEFSTIYNLDVVEMPTNLDFIANKAGSELQVLQAKDEEGYAFTYYAHSDDSSQNAVFWKRKDFPDVVYRSEEAKLRAIVLEIVKFQVIGRPILVGTTSIEHSERLSRRLQPESLRRLLMLLLTRESWLRKHNIQSPERIIPELDFLNQPLKQVSLDDARRLAHSCGLSTLNPESEDNLRLIQEYLGLAESDLARLEAVARGGIPHQVLNALKHDQESQIITGAGAFGAVTIATNMAGRGVDIKLGGEIQESTLTDVRHFLDQAGVDPYGLSHAALAQQLALQPVDQFGDYAESIQTFLDFMHGMQQVRAVGGLHVIGSERHEARRIDNQLRGRAARQGDPGSSRFYLSLEDDLMRMFGGERAENMMRMFNIDPSVPLESKMLGRLVEQAQERVEGYNFDIRKHLLDYDNVLNDQRERIYSERDRVLTKGDMEEDVLEMLRHELKQRIPTALADEESPWKLLAFLEEVQPTIIYPQYGEKLPSFTLALIQDFLKQAIGNRPDADTIKSGLLELAQKSIQAESTRVLNQTSDFIQRTASSYAQQVAERFDLLDIFLENNLEQFQSSPREFINELQTQVHLKLTIEASLLQKWKDFPKGLEGALREQVDGAFMKIILSRLVMGIERRINSRLQVNLDEMAQLDWLAVEQRLLVAVEQFFREKESQIQKPESQIWQNIESLLRTIGEGSKEIDLFDMANGLTAGTQMAIDPRTRQRVTRRVNLLNYIFLAAQELENQEATIVADEILAHLEKVQQRMQLVWGKMELERMSENTALFSQLPKEYRHNLENFITPEASAALEQMPMADLLANDHSAVIQAFGRFTQQTIYRHILLHAISELWVEQLTRMEALRVSIGMEAYAQQDPLVQYKSRSTEAFKDLFTEIRMGVISRMFRLQPGKPQSPAVEVKTPVRSTEKVERPKEEKKRKRHKKR